LGELLDALRAGGRGLMTRERPPSAERGQASAPRWLVQPTTWAAMGAVLLWFAIQLGPFVGDAPDLDAMVSLRDSLVVFHHGFHGLIARAAGAGIHPPLLDLLNVGAFTVFGEDPRSQQILAILLFAGFAAAVERLLAPWLGSVQRVVAAFVISICPSLAIAMFLVSREALIFVTLVVALLPAVRRRPVALGLVLALLPLTKENGVVLVLPFAVDAVLAARRERESWLRRVALVAGPSVAAALGWRVVLALLGGSSWHAWVFSSHADDGPYVVAGRAMLGLEHWLYLRQNLANAFVVNYLWLPALLAVVTLVLLVRRATDPAQRRVAALVVALALLYAWTTLTFPTFTEPRYATPLTMLTILLVLLGLPQWPRVARPVVLGALLVVFVAGAWSPTDPVSRALFGTTSIGGERVYDTDVHQRGPDRIDLNFALLRITRGVNDRLRRIYSTDAALVTGDCNTLKFGEKLFTVGSFPEAFDRDLPGARPLRCVPISELPSGAATGPEHIVLVRTPEEDARKTPLGISGPSILVVR
jgi:hypothetical protein